MSVPSPTQVQELLASMPSGYRTAFSEEEILDHARAVVERREAPACVAVCRSPNRQGEMALCIVADDRPGLLAVISAALVLHDLDVVRAEAFTRTRANRRAEVVALFWVRRSESAARKPWDPTRVAELQVTLSLLLDGRVSVQEVARRCGYAMRTRARETRVRFLEGEDGGLAVLEVETVDRTGLLLALAEALYEARVDIARAEVATEQGKVRDRFRVTEIGGAPIGPARRLKIQVAVLGAIQPTTEPRRQLPKAAIARSL